MKKIVLAFLVVLSSLSYGQTLTIDPNFINLSIDSTNGIRSTVLQPDGKIIVFGGLTTFDGQSVSCIVRINADGTIDNSFNTGSGFLSGDGVPSVFDVKILSNGKIIVVGRFDSYNNFSRSSIIRLNSDGSLDTSFRNVQFYTGTINGFPVRNEINQVEISSEGKIYIGGTFSLSLFPYSYGLAKLNSNGSTDTSFLGGTLSPTGEVYCLKLQDDGKLIVGGSFTDEYYSGFYRLNADGSEDAAFEHSADYGRINKIVIEPDGKILLGGLLIYSLSEQNYNILTRINSDGSPDGTFQSIPARTSGSSTYGIFDIKMYLGKILIGGRGLTYFNSGGNGQLFLLNLDGSIDTSFNIGQGFSFTQDQDAYIYSITLQPDNKILLAGRFLAYNDTAAYSLTRLNAFTLGLNNYNHYLDVFAYKKSEVINFVSYSSPIAAVDIFDTTGKLIHKEEDIRNSNYSVFINNNVFLISKVTLVDGSVKTIKIAN